MGRSRNRVSARTRKRILRGGAAAAAAANTVNGNSEIQEQTANNSAVSVSSGAVASSNDIGIRNGIALTQYLSADEYKTYFDETNPKLIYSDHAPVVYQIPDTTNPDKIKIIITWNIAKYGNVIIKSVANKQKKTKKNQTNTALQKTLKALCPNGEEKNINLIVEFAHKFNGGLNGAFPYCQLTEESKKLAPELRGDIYTGIPEDGVEKYSHYKKRLENIATAISQMYKEYKNPIIMLQELPDIEIDMMFFIEKLNEHGLNLKIEKLPKNEKDKKQEQNIENIRNNNERLVKISNLTKRALVRDSLQKGVEKRRAEKKKKNNEEKAEKEKRFNPEYPYKDQSEANQDYTEFGIVVKLDDQTNFNYDLSTLHKKTLECIENKKEDKTKKDIIKRYSIYLNKENDKNIYYVCLHCWTKTEEDLIKMLNDIIKCTIEFAEEKHKENSELNLYPNQFIFAGDFNRIMHTPSLVNLFGTNQQLYTTIDGKGNNLSNNKGLINPKGNIDLVITTDIQLE